MRCEKHCEKQHPETTIIMVQWKITPKFERKLILEIHPFCKRFTVPQSVD